MPADPANQPRELVATDLPEFLENAACQTWPMEREKSAGPQSYRVAFGREPIQLGHVEFRILLFLASRPYHAFTRREIVKAVAWAQDSVTEADDDEQINEYIDEHIAALRAVLGVLNDYVQTVPYIGYRFKA